MAGRAMKYVTSKPSKGLRRGNVGMRSIIATSTDPIGPTSATGYYNAINPRYPGKYVVYKVINGAAPLSFTPQSDAEFIRVCNQLGASVTTVSDGLEFIAGEDDLSVGAMLNATGSTDINPFAVYDALGANPSQQNEWFDTKAPDNMYNLSQDGTPQHSLTEYVCVETQTTVRWAAPYTGTIIYEIDTDGSITTKVSATSGPTNGNFSCTANKRYVANKPIHMHRTSAQHAMIPGSLKGTNWGFYFSRNEPITVYLYSYDDCKYAIFSNAVQISNLVTKGSLTAGVTSTYVFTDDVYDNTRINIIASKPILCSIEGTGGDRSIASIAGPFSFRRDTGGYSSTTAGVNPSTTDTNVVYDSSLDSWAFDIGDGSGGDSENSMPNNMISQHYTFGSKVDNYTIVNPNGAQDVVVESWNGSAWINFATHTLGAGSNTAPTTAQTGSTSDLNANTLWKWTGEDKFYLLINDASADEESMQGWNSGHVESFFL